ncbi:MAG: hypothetical protein JSC189_000183 [Candidatus Tokpelaia sp. JSC189]|nr:MAG: hypothetical protein JSC189_000183 [Candidatus Tokpelaia sp. JSC189]
MTVTLDHKVDISLGRVLKNLLLCRFSSVALCVRDLARKDSETTLALINAFDVTNIILQLKWN